MQEPRRPLGKSGLMVSPVAMGCWPIAGITSIGVNDADSAAALSAACDAGIDFFDTAYCYGYDGESERLLARTLGHRRGQLTIATKGGIEYRERRQVRAGAPGDLRRQCEESLRRLATDRIDLLYLHAPDPAVPLEESAGELARLLAAGKTRAVGLSNASAEQCARFAAVCPLTAVQPPYNMLQREIEADLLPWCVANDVAICAYWPLMKGLLAGQLPRDHRFDPADGRAKYPVFQGAEWDRTQDFLDEVRRVAARAGKTVAQTVLNWTIQQPGITVALAGGKRAAQMAENAGAMGWRLADGDRAALDDAIRRRGPVPNRRAVS